MRQFEVAQWNITKGGNVACMIKVEHTEEGSYNPASVNNGNEGYTFFTAYFDQDNKFLDIEVAWWQIDAFEDVDAVREQCVQLTDGIVAKMCYGHQYEIINGQVELGYDKHFDFQQRFDYVEASLV